MKAQITQWLQRRWRWLAIVAGAIAIYALAGFFWVPHLARNAITDYVTNTLHRRVAIGDLKFNPFTFTARVRQFTLSEADGAEIASFDGLLVNAELSSLIHLGAAFKEIRIDHPRVSVRVNADGSLNLAKLRPPNAPSADAKSSKSEIPHILIGTLAIHRGEVLLEDFSRPQPFSATLTPIEFSLTNFRTDPNFENGYRFTASTPEVEKLEWSGEFSVQPFGSKGRFTLTNILATTIGSYLQNTLPFDLQSGSLDVQGEYRLAVEDRLHLQITLPTVKGRDFGLAVRSTDSTKPWIVVPQLSLTDASVTFPERALSIGDIHLSDVSVEAWRAQDGSVNLLQLFSSPSTAPTSSNASANAASWKINLKNISLEHARVNAEDRSIAPNAKFTFAPINLKIANYSNEPGSSLTFETSIGVNDNGVVTASGPLSVSPLATDLTIAANDLNLTALQPYAAQSTDLTIHRGKLSLKSRLRYAAQPAKGEPLLKISGDAEIIDLLTKDNALQEDFIKWQSLKVSGLDYQLSPDRLSIASIRARKPYGRVIIASNSTLNVKEVLSPQKTAAASATNKSAGSATSHSPLPVRIKSVIFEDGSASFADYSVMPSFASEIDSINGTVEGLSSEQNSRAKVQLKGSVDRYAPVSIDGVVNILARDAYTDIAMSFRNMELTTFNPYSGKFAGYNITKGKLTTEMEYKVENRKLDARHHIVVDQLEFGEATGSKDAVSLPVKLAVALLKDRHGVINLDLPIKGSIDDPSFRLGPIIWQVLKNTLEKIVTAPFALLGSLFGGGEELAFVDFAYGSATLSSDASGKLDKLKTALVERPQLRLDIPVRAFEPADATAMAHERLEQIITPLINKKTDRLGALTATYTKEFGKPPTFPEISDKQADVAAEHTKYLEEMLLGKFTPTPAQLDELARQRGGAVRDALVSSGEISAERVFLTGRGAESKGKDVVRLELKLE